VRRSVLYVTTLLLATVPVNALLENFIEEFDDTRAWLVSISKDDADDICRYTIFPPPPTTFNIFE